MRSLGRTCRFCAGFLAAGWAASAAPAAAERTAAPTVVRPVVTLPALPESYPRPAATWLDAQVELARRAFSCGSIDGIQGPQSVAALRAFQESEDLPVTGALDEETCEHLSLASPPLGPRTVTQEELDALQPLSPTWLGKSQQTSLAYETALELLAERSHASQAFLRALNPGVDWLALGPDTVVTVPQVVVRAKGRAERLLIGLADHTLEAFDADGRILAHFPVSIAHRVEKRPVGELHVVVVVKDPDYTFDPEVFPESEEARTLAHKLRLPPGPNNPVGVAWVGLDRQGYGIHGTPEPEHVGRTESHGCFRLTNWDAETLLGLSWIGLPVVVDP